MKKKILFRGLLVGLLGLIALIPGVSAAWSYSYLPAGGKGIEVGNFLMDSYYKSERKEKQGIALFEKP